MGMRKLTVLCAAKLPPNLLERYLEPLDMVDEIREILVVRHEPLETRLSKVRNVTFRDGGTTRNMWRMFRAVDDSIRRYRADWVLGFNPVPWGSVGTAAAARHRVPVSLSFIGMDFKHLMRPIGAPIWLAVRRAQIITVTGQRMRAGLIQRGVPPDKIRVLPHVVDTRRFTPGEGAAEFDVVSVGHLIHRKRMDVLIDAVAILRDRGVRTRVAILGKGPLESALRNQIERLGVQDRIHLLGFRSDVEAVLRRGRLFALVSEWEGVPFAMIEAMCAGLVPIVTDVGTIADWIADGRNGHIVPVGDPTALADVIERLTRDHAHFESLRSEALTSRRTLSLDRGAEFWRDALNSFTH